MIENKIQSLLTDVGLSRSELARSASVPYATVRRVINAGGDLPLAYGLAIARVLQVHVEDLFRLSASQGDADALHASLIEAARDPR